MQHPLDKLVRSSLSGSMPALLLVLSLFLGFIALQYTAREEEPQIVVPMIDVLLDVPGLSARQIERQVTTPLEKILSQIKGVEHVYSVSQSGGAAITLRFFVGEDREDAILNTYNKLYSNQELMPHSVAAWKIDPIEVDDVPILMLGLYSTSMDVVDDSQLRRLAEELVIRLQAINNTSDIQVIGGRPRTVTAWLKPEALAAHKTTVADIVHALSVSNSLSTSGNWTLNNASIQLQAGDFLRSANALREQVVNVVDGAPVRLMDVADITDAPAEPDSYTMMDFGRNHQDYTENTSYPMVAISIAKKQGSNAVKVAEDVHQRIADIQKELFPDNVKIEVLRDYGKTADDKVNNLTSSLGFAVFTVVIFIGVFLGWRPAVVVGLAIPVCYGLTLILDMAFGYTINRVTLFALILSLGLLVDDPITGVDNIERFIAKPKTSVNDAIVAAIGEIRTPLVMSTLTIVLAFIPLAFITGMMGPYMAPMAFNVPVSVMSSTLVAFVLTPWLSQKILKSRGQEELLEDSKLLAFYRRFLTPVLNNKKQAKAVLWFVLFLFMAAALLPVLRMVPLKLLPFDNKNEVQVLIDMPEGSSLEATAALTENIIAELKRVPEVNAIASFVGVPSAIDFNGMVRRYYQRRAEHLADIRLTLVDKTEREHQSHGVVLRLREQLKRFNQQGVNIKVIEVPPGPPVLSTLVVEIYGESLTPYAEQQRAAQILMERLQREPHVVEIDSTVEAAQQRLRFIADKTKAALSGVSTEDINLALSLADSGVSAGIMQYENEVSPLPILLKLPQQERSSLNDLQRLQVKGIPGYVQSTSQSITAIENAPQNFVAIGELGEFVEQQVETSIHHKDLQPVVYVMAELSGRTPAEVIADVHADYDEDPNNNTEVSDWQDRTFLNSGSGVAWHLPEGTSYKWTGEGEWKITVSVFRDMGLAFAFALVAIFVVLRIQTSSSALSLIIMSSIPLTIIGIMPGFWLLNQFGEREIAGAPEPVLFTATAMIGMIALAGIVVRNSLILVEFIQQAQAEGLALKEALVQAGAVRMRPVLLTAGTTLLGNLVIILDPVFSGLALAIIFGIIASTLFTLIVVPVVYLLVFGNEEQETAYAE